MKGDRLIEFQKSGHDLDIRYSGERESELGWANQIELSRPAQRALFNKPSVCKESQKEIC